MSSVKIFEHPDFGRLEVVEHDGKPWLVGKAVAEMLGYADPSSLYRRLDDDEKTTLQIPQGGSNYTTNIVIINESGFYNAVLGSSKPEARRFKKWVTSEVLPDIQKHGFYGTDRFVEMVMADPLAMSRFFQEYHFEKERRVLAERQRDYAVETKAWIGEKKVATAMNTASQYSKQNERLKVQIGDSTNWKTVKAIKWLREGRSKYVA
jgi:prophage antirepressor-like protein